MKRLDLWQIVKLTSILLHAGKENIAGLKIKENIVGFQF